MIDVAASPRAMPVTTEKPSSAFADPNIRVLATLSPIHTYLEIAFTWIQILVIIGVTLAFDSPLATVIGAILVGIRQYALLILLHDGSHGLLHNVRKVNDQLSLWLLAAPCGSTFVNSRLSHLMHHRFLGNPALDPDYSLYCLGPPAPKHNLPGIIFHLVRLVFGGQIMHTLFQEKGRTKNETPIAVWIRKSQELLPVVLVQIAILFMFILANHSFGYLFLWVLPLVTVAVLLNGARVFFDHAHSSEGDCTNAAPLVSYVSSTVERLLLAPYNMNYHAEHHLFPYIPHYNLPRLRKLLLEDQKYRTLIHFRCGYFSYLLQHVRAQQVS